MNSRELIAHLNSFREELVDNRKTAELIRFARIAADEIGKRDTEIARLKAFINHLAPAES